ncbi:MAG: hypothetical protein WCC27_15980 [Acidobacteriaceae bacterium]
MQRPQGWSFAVVGRDVLDVAKFLGVFDDYNEATKFRDSAELVGWHDAVVVGAAEVKTGAKSR